MRHPIEPREQINVKRYGFLSFAKYTAENLSIKYTQKLPDSAETSTRESINISSKLSIQKIP